MCLVVGGFKHWPFSVYILGAVLQFTFLDACTKSGKQCIKIGHVLIFTPACDLEVVILSLARLLLLCWSCSCSCSCCCCCWWWWWCCCCCCCCFWLWLWLWWLLLLLMMLILMLMLMLVLVLVLVVVVGVPAANTGCPVESVFHLGPMAFVLPTDDSKVYSNQPGYWAVSHPY